MTNRSGIELLIVVSGIELFIIVTKTYFLSLHLNNLRVSVLISAEILFHILMPLF